MLWVCIWNESKIIDNQFVANIPYGSTRMDVKAAHPEYPNSENSGFAMIWNYSILSPGYHPIQIIVHNQDGQTTNFYNCVYVSKFHGEFVINVVPGSRLLENNAVTVDGITRNYDIWIVWSNGTQGFQITDVIEK